MGMPVRKKRVGLEDRAEQRQVKIQFKTVDRPASGVAHKFPRRSYNLLLNYSLSRGCRATEPLSSFYIPRYWYARLENRCLRRRYIGPDIETEEPRDRFHSFHPSGQSIRDSKIYHQFPSIQHETDTDRNRPPFNSKIRQCPFPFLPLYPKPVSLVTVFYPMNRRIWFNQGRVPKK